MATFKEIRAIQHPNRNEDFYLKYVYRTIDIPFTWLFITLHIDTKIVTLLGMVIDFLAAYFVVTFNPIWAAICIQLAIMLDGVDGEVARYKYWKYNVPPEKRPKLGGYMDKVLGLPGFAVAMFAIGLINNAPWAGLFAVLTMCMINVAAHCAKVMFPEIKSKIAQMHESKLGKWMAPFEFGMSAQKGVITLAALNIYPVFFLWLFTAAGSLYWLAKFWIYRNN